MLIALRILFNILMFGSVMFFTSLLIEKFYAGRMRWPAFSVLTVIMIGFSIRTDVALQILNALFMDFSMTQLGMVLIGGILSGVFISFSCIFFRLVQMILSKIISSS